jgi:hypothetical protein
VTLDVVKDTFAPTVAVTSIAQNASLYYVKSVQVTFNKPLDTSKLLASGVSLVNTTDNVTYPVTITTRSFGQVVSFLFAQVLPQGSYQLSISPSDIVDLSGNVLAAPIVPDHVSAVFRAVSSSDRHDRHRL